MLERKRRLDQLVQGRAEVENKRSTASSDPKSQEKKSREELRSPKQSLAQQTEKERELRGTLRGSIKGGREQEKHWSEISTHLSKSAAS